MSLKITALSHHIVDGNNSRCLLSKLSFAIAQGECIALMGDSGSGKTTLLNLIAGLEPIQQGDVAVADLSLAISITPYLSINCVQESSGHKK